jgi:hypothetical protein
MSDLSQSQAIFATGLQAQEKQDISDLLLQADVFASSAWDRKVHWQSWLDYHASRLKKHGCKVRATLINPPRFIDSEQALAEPFDLLVQGCEDSPLLVGMLSDGLNQSGYLGFCRTFLRHGTGPGHLADFQIVPCAKRADGDLSLLVCGLQAKGLYTDDRREVVLRLTGVEYSFDSRDYDAYRDEVKQHLVRYATQRIKHTDL